MDRYRSSFLKNNIGVSLIELIIVIAIMSIMTGGVALSISLVFSKDAANCATRLDDVLTEARMLTMSREGNYTLEITQKDGMYYAVIKSKILKTDGDGNPEVDGDGNPVYDDDYYAEHNLEGDSNKRIESIKCSKCAASDKIITSSTPVRIVFNRTKGNIYSINDIHPVTDDVLVFDIEAQRGSESRKKSKVSVVTGTGKHTVGDF